MSESNARRSSQWSIPNFWWNCFWAQFFKQTLVWSLLTSSDGQFTGIVGAHMTSSTDDISIISAGDLIEAIAIGDDRHSDWSNFSERQVNRNSSKLHSNFDTKKSLLWFQNEANKGGLHWSWQLLKWFIPVSQLTRWTILVLRVQIQSEFLNISIKLIGKILKVHVIT